MKTIQSIKSHYDEGRITGFEAGCDILTILSQANVNELAGIGTELLREVEEAVECFLHHRQTYGLVVHPTEEQVELAKRWLRDNRSHPETTDG